jgi:hypothetical protein
MSTTKVTQDILWKRNMVQHQFNEEKLLQIDAQVRDWVAQQESIRDKVASGKSSDGETVTVEEVSGLSFTASKEGEKFSHWAVQVGSQFYYHLVFLFPQGSQNPKSITFRRDLVEHLEEEPTRKPRKVVVGKTNLTSEEIMVIGNHLITCFGSYYQAFWNCQHFAKILLKLILGTETLFLMESTTDWAIGVLVRSPSSGECSAATVRQALEAKEQSVVDSLDPEFVTILQFLHSNSRPQPPAPGWFSYCSIL